eukprot:GHVN01065340.1.p2 GENE.GHVN01065340.1~~GHVN01065340.1.p2  ORF type:complete len:113 (-),score=27.90 GHVN01065340.1:159-497(-)
MERPAFLFDGKNMLDGKRMHSLGFEYDSVGHASLSHFESNSPDSTTRLVSCAHLTCSSPKCSPQVSPSTDPLSSPPRLHPAGYEGNTPINERLMGGSLVRRDMERGVGSRGG